MSLVGLAAQHSPLAFSPLVERHTLQYSSSPSLGKAERGGRGFLYIHHYYTSPRAATPPSRIIRIIAFLGKSRAENVMNCTKSRAQNVIIVVKSRAENVMIYFFVFKWQSGICCLLMPQVSDFQYKAWLLHRREIGLMCQPIRQYAYKPQ